MFLEDVTFPYNIIPQAGRLRENDVGDKGPSEEEELLGSKNLAIPEKGKVERQNMRNLPPLTKFC